MTSKDDIKGLVSLKFLRPWLYGYKTDKKENEIFLIYTEIQMGVVAKSHMRKDFLIYEEMQKYLKYVLNIWGNR